MTVAVRAKRHKLTGFRIGLQLTRRIGIVVDSAKRHYRRVFGPAHYTGALSNRFGESYAPTSDHIQARPSEGN